MKIGLFLTLGVLSTVGFVACGGADEPEPSPTPDNSTISRIAFASNRDGNWEVYVMNSDGSNPHNVTNHPSIDSYPSWSPTGSKIAFQSERDGNFEIYVMNSDGSNQVRMTNDRGKDHSPAWSPDGSKIAFVSDRRGRQSIWIMNSEDGSELEDLTGSFINSRWPTWGPKSRSIFYESDGDVRVLRIDGLRNEKILEADNFFDGFFVGWLDWSPDGDTLALISNHQERTEFTRLLYTSQLDGFRFRRLYNEPSGQPYERPSWAPDSNMIAFSVKNTETGGDWDILAVDFTTQGTWRLTNDPATDMLPDWEPRGFVPNFEQFGQ